jgi:hypothetical protein
MRAVTTMVLLIAHMRRKMGLPIFLTITLLYPYTTVGQIRSSIVLPIANDSGYPHLYTALGCLDDHNCLACALVLKQTYTGIVDRSTDGGLTWQQYRLPIKIVDARSDFFQTVYFIDSLNIILTGSGGLIYRSMDGGVTWSDRSYVSLAAGGEPAFIDSAFGAVAMGAGTVITTTDGGVSWDSVGGLPYRLLNSPKWVDRDTLLVYLQGANTIYSLTAHSIDSVKLPFDRTLTDTGGYRSIGEIKWMGGQEAFAAGLHYVKDDRDVNHFRQLQARTTDNGRTWAQILDEDFGDHIWGFSANKPGSGILFGDAQGHIKWTRDWRSGIWISDTVTADSSFLEISQAVFLDSETVLARFDNGTIILGPSDGFIGKFRLPESRSVLYFESLVRNALLFPNPASTTLNVRVPARTGRVRLIDILGREVAICMISNGGATCTVASLADGVYSVILDLNNQRIPLGKVLVQH